MAIVYSSRMRERIRTVVDSGTRKSIPSATTRSSTSRCTSDGRCLTTHRRAASSRASSARGRTEDERDTLAGRARVIGDRFVQPLSQVECLVMDCQATAAAQRGHLLEIAWARSPALVPHTRAHLIALSRDEKIPPAVARITGISEPMMRCGVDPAFAWRALADDAARLSV